MPYMADIFGRKPLVSFAMALCTIFYTVLMFTESLQTMIVVSFVLGMLSSARENVGFVYLTELMPKSS
jgi:MFS family permease